MGGGGERGGRQGGGDGGGRKQSGVQGDVPVDMDYTNAEHNEDGGKNIRKMLVAPDGAINVRGQPVPNLAGNVLMIENTAVKSSGGGETSTPGKFPVVKRRKQGEDGVQQNDDQLNSAASRAEDRRSQ